MKQTNPKKLQAILLRKEKKSYNEIARELNVSKSTVSYWFRGIDWSRDIQEQLAERMKSISRVRLNHLNDLKRKKWKKVYEDAEIEAIREFETLKDTTLFSAGISLYWGEGDKDFSNGKVRVSNIDCHLLSVFRIFLQETCRVEKEKIKAYLLLYPDLDENTCLEYWEKNVGIAKENFFKSTFIQGKHKTRRLGHGVCSLQVSDKRLKKKVLTWIEMFSKIF